MVYLWRRNVLRQSLSGHMAAAKDLWFAEKNDAEDRSKVQEAVYIDPDALLRDAYERRTWLKKERSVLEEIDFFEVNYEDDLMTDADRERMLPDLFRFLGVESMVFQPETTRTSKSPSDQIKNYGEVRERVDKTPFEGMI